MCAISGMRQWKVHALFISPIPLMRQLRNWLFWLVQILMAEPLTNWVSEWLYKPKPSLHPHRPAQDIKRAAGKETHFCCIKTLKLWIFLLLEHNLIHSLMLFNHSLVSNSLQPHGLHHTRLSCPSLSPRICSNSCPLNRWCNPIFSSSVAPFSCCLQSFPASSFSMSQLIASGAQSIGASASASVLPMTI